jgi:hypothetical protein
VSLTPNVDRALVAPGSPRPAELTAICTSFMLCERLVVGAASMCRPRAEADAAGSTGGWERGAAKDPHGKIVGEIRVHFCGTTWPPAAGFHTHSP